MAARRLGPRGFRKPAQEFVRELWTYREAEIMTDESVRALLDLLRTRGETITTVESCTGGLLAGRITDIPGSSEVFRRGFITYCDEAKAQMVDVKEETLAAYTAVSPQTAEEMALGGASKAGASACLSVTGYAGPPSGPEDTLVGLVYIGCFYGGSVSVRELHLSGSRRQIRQEAVEEALKLLQEQLNVRDKGGTFATVQKAPKKD